MKIHLQSRRGLTLVELTVTSAMVGVLGLVIYSLLNIGTILGAKNTAMNTAHQQARIAMLKMIEDLHSAVSLPALQGVVGVQASGISFQQWGARLSNGVMTTNGGPHKIIEDANVGDDHIHIQVAPNQPRPIVGQRVIVPTHQIEATIVDTKGGSSDFELEFATPLTVAIKGTTSSVGDVVCYITDRCSYDIVQVSAGPPAVYKLQWTYNQTTRDIVNDITNPRPFSIPTTPAGALYYRFVAAIDLSTSDPKYSRRGYKSANILLNGQVPFKARLTTYQ
jgi:prepilin-type N-terminal cleavage/methylation domain-containing protein